ncbi:MAG: hypothetical protein RSG77_17655 [Hafnia sp.]
MPSTPAAPVVAAKSTPAKPEAAQSPALSSRDVMLQDAYRAEERKDFASALALYTSAADQGSDQAHYELARIYAQSQPQDLVASNQHLIRASELGNAEATRVLAWQYLRGAGVEKDAVKAASLFDKAAESSVRAQREAGMLYANAFVGYPLNDNAKGLQYLRSATAAGDAEAAFYLYQNLTQSGVATPESDSAMVLAIQKEYPKALFVAGGFAMKKGKYEQASQVYLKAAMRGDADSMYAYANNVLLKRFPSSDRELEAYTWFSIAADKQHQESMNELKAQQGLKKMLERTQPGRLDNMISQTKLLIQPWQSN